jgi:hypothetical protein
LRPINSKIACSQLTGACRLASGKLWYVGWRTFSDARARSVVRSDAGIELYARQMQHQSPSQFRAVQRVKKNNIVLSAEPNASIRDALIFPRGMQP